MNILQVAVILIKKFLKNWNNIIKKSDIFFPIAPETENKLIELIKLNKFKKKMLSNEINAIKISSSKYKTYKFFQKNSIPTLKTFNVKKKDLKITKSWVAKPDDGAGCEDSKELSWWFYKSFNITKILFFEGGFPEWKNKEMPIE